VRSRLRLALLVLGPLALALLLWGWWRGVESARASQRELAELQARMARLESATAELRREVAALQREKEAKARAAREVLDVAAPGEVVVVTPDTGAKP
jgi:cell division protein FtsB